MTRHGSSPRWNRARIVFECSPIIAPNAVSRRTMTLVVYGHSEFAALHALRMQFPRHGDFLILHIQWTDGAHGDADD